MLRVSFKEAAGLESSIISSKCRSGMRVNIFLSLLCGVKLCLREENTSVWHHLCPALLGIVAVLAFERNVSTSTSKLGWPLALKLQGTDVKWL